MSRYLPHVGIVVVLVAIMGVIMLPGVLPQAKAGSAAQEGEHEALVRMNGASCGVERWAVKTGTDNDAHAVNLKHVVSNTVYAMRRLPAPGYLAPRNRVSSVEKTAWRLSAILLRYKDEADSDYHLVIADTGGRTMIAEIPDPACVGASSPFRSRIRSARATFDRHYQVTSEWHRVHQWVTLTGVGFFDFKHGQSGVAPNAIELHPLLSISFRRSNTGSAPAPPPPPPPSSGSGTFSLKVWVSPSSMSHNAYPTLYAKTHAGAQCSASVTYSTGYPPRSFDGSTRTVPASGTISWSWHEETSGSGGTARASCTYRGQTKSASASFNVTTL
jgi:hypothetical protein